MKFEIETHTLLNAVSNVSRVIDKVSVLPVLSNLKIHVYNNSIALTGSNGVSTIRQVIDTNGGIQEEGECLVEAKYFNEILRKVSGDKVLVECTDNLMMIRSDRAKFKLTCTDVSEYPDVDLNICENRLNCSLDMLKDAFNKTLVCVLPNDTRPILGGININIENGLVKMSGSDSYRLNQYSFMDNDCADANITVPKRACEDFLKMMNGEVEARYDSNKIQFLTKSIHYQSQLLSGTYPDVSRIIPTSNNYRVEIEKLPMIDAIKRCDFVKNDGRQIVNLKFDSESHLSSKNKEIGETDEVLEKVEALSGPIEMNLNGKFLKDALESLDSEKVMIETPGFEKPLVVHGEDTKMLCVLVPVRTY